MATNARKSAEIGGAFRETAAPQKNAMNRTGHKGRVDLNHAQIINGLRQAGIAAYSIASVGDGIPDILAGFRGVCVILEVKRYNEEPTQKEKEFADRWPGQYAIVNNPEEAIQIVYDHARRCGVSLL